MADKKPAPDNALESEAKTRLQDARRQKAQFEVDMRECYFFMAPHRMRTVSSTTSATSSRTRDAELLSTSFGFELSGDFPTVIINTFMPETQRWVVRRAGPTVPRGMREKAEEMARQADEDVFKLIHASNFYEEFGKGADPDLAIGVSAIYIDHPKPHEPPVCQAVPIRELEINVGPDGRIADRFMVRYAKMRDLEKIIPGKTGRLPPKLVEKRARDASARCQVVWGFWPIYDDTGDEKWQHTLSVDGHLIDSAKLTGRGSCPLIVGRFGATSEWAWAPGPAIKALPDLRMMDELAAKKIKNVDLNLEPPISFPDGSFTNIQDGIEAGMAYAIRPGEHDAIKNIYDPPPPDVAIYATQELETRLKRLFFLDWPQQDGKTPPTATQWLDEMTLAQRRIGTPGRVFWAEFCGGSYMRFLYLAEKAGIVEPVKLEVGGTKQAVAMMPYNPAQRSAEQEDVALFTRFVQVAAAAFPEEFKMGTDGVATIEAIAAKMGVTELWKRRDPQAIQGAIDNIAKLSGGTPSGAPALPNGAAPPADLAGPAANQPTFALQGQGL
jgi:hypothetical protein